MGDEAREFYQLEQGGNISLIAPSYDIENSLKFIDQLRHNIEEDTQMPNLSLENIKTLSGVVSGEARKTLLSDAHLKAGEVTHDIQWFLDREYSVIKSIVARLNIKYEKYVEVLNVTHRITPFIQNDEATLIDNRIKANGGNPIESQKESILRYGKSEDADATYEAIMKEQERSKKIDSIEELFV